MNVDSRLTAMDAETRLSLLHDYLSDPLRKASAPFLRNSRGISEWILCSVDREMVYI